MGKILTRTDKQTLRAFFNATQRHKKEFYLTWLQVVNVVAITILVPYATSNILALLVVSNGSITPYFILLVASSILGVLTNRIGFSAIMQLVAKVSHNLQETVFSMLLGRSAGFHANHSGGKLISDAADYPRAYMQLHNAFYIELLPFLITVVVGTCIILVQSFVLGLIILTMTGVVLGWAWWKSRSQQENRAERKNAQREVISHIGDTISNVMTAKSFAKEDSERNEHLRRSRKLQKYRIRDWTFVATDGSNRYAALLAVQIIFVAYLIQLTRQQPETLAVGIFAFSYTITMTNRLFQVNTIIRNIEEGLLEAAPMTEYLAQRTEITDAKDAKDIVVTTGAIKLIDVTFSYAEKQQTSDVFSKLSMNIKPGERVGLVGPSGGGKSTLMKLLLRFEDISSGQILIDNQNIASVTQRSLRSSISYVAQEPLLFHRTVAENILYGADKQVSRQTLITATKKAFAYDFISALPNGFNTVVGERGVKLSGGQRQRIAIARAVLKDAPILLLDEATSALDSESESYIQKALHELMKNKTVLVIAHRLSTINELDRIIVIDGGLIKEQGSHKQLIKTNGLYAKLWNHQSGGFIED